MSRQPISVRLHLRETLEPAHRQALRRTLAREAGVKQTRPSPKTPKPLTVHYDPIATNARRILDAVRSPGISARLVGL